jgi:hypothetical protein
VLVGLSPAEWAPGEVALLILIRIVFPPGFSGSVGGGKSIEPTLEVGVFLALAAACGITFGGYMTMRQEGHSLANLRGGDAADRSGAAD